MKVKKKIFSINGSASQNSSNQKLIEKLIEWYGVDYDISIFTGLKTLPHFTPELSVSSTPEKILEIRKEISNADGVIICTPEYVFSIPSGLKNLIEWCVSKTVFSDKPLAIITASADGQAGHQELQHIMKTLMAKFSAESTLLIQGVKGKFDEEGKLIDNYISEKLKQTFKALEAIINELEIQV